MAYYFDFSVEKNKMLLETRGICFEHIITLISEGCILDIMKHPKKKKYPNQNIYIMDVDDYCYLVSYVKNKQEIFLKTIIPTCKATNQYLEKRRRERNMSDKQKYILEREEKEISTSFEKDDLSSALNAENMEKVEAISAAKIFLRKTERINIRMNAYDLSHIKRRAAQEGIPYQTLISSILHKYVTGYSS